MSAEPQLSPTPPQPSKAVMKLVQQAVLDFALIQPGDRIAVGVSGGKDSLLLIACIRELSLRDDMDFEWGVVHLDQKQPGFDHAAFRVAMARLGVEAHIVEEDTHSRVQEQLKPGQIPCSICARMRRGILNQWCASQGFTKLAIGHHLDDAIETFLLNLFYGRRLDPLKAATPASKHEVTTIRPLILVEESKVRAWVINEDLAPVACPVCDTFPASKRRDIKALLTSFEDVHPGFRESVRSGLYEG